MTMKTYLLTLSSKKKKLAIQKEKFGKLDDKRLSSLILAGWMRKSSKRMSIYKGIKLMQGSVKDVLEQARYKTLESAFSEVRKWTKQEAHLQLVTKRLLTHQRKKRLTKGFASLETNMRRCISQRRALNLLSQILVARDLKQECFNLVTKKAQRHVVHIEFSKLFDGWFKQHSKRLVIRNILGYNQKQLGYQIKAEHHLKSTAQMKCSKIIKSWKAIVDRKNMVNMKADNLEKTLEGRLIARLMGIWSSKVFGDKFSLYCRFKTLEKCLTQVRAIRAIDQMHGSLALLSQRPNQERKEEKASHLDQQR